MYASLVVISALVFKNESFIPIKILSELKHYAMFEIICTAFIGITCKEHQVMMLEPSTSWTYIEYQ
jgi:hypothetical protein